MKQLQQIENLANAANQEINRFLVEVQAHLERRISGCVCRNKKECQERIRSIMGTNKKTSPAIKLLRMMWDYQGGAKSHSWDRINHSMRDILSLVITSGFRFYQDDFKRIANEFRFSYWAGTDGHMWGEGYYSTACGGRDTYGSNISACIAFEKWKERPPYILKTHRNKSGYRLSIGEQFMWFGERVTVTSFSKDGDYLTACSYDRSEGVRCKECKYHTVYPHEKLEHRYKITHEQLKDHNRALLTGIKMNDENKDMAIVFQSHKRGYLFGYKKGKAQIAWGANGEFVKPKDGKKIKPFSSLSLAIAKAREVIKEQNNNGN